MGDSKKSEYIEREALIHSICDLCDGWCDMTLAGCVGCKSEHQCDPVMAIKEAPAADVVEVKHGRWENHPRAYGFVRCSVCNDCNIWGEWADGKKWNYCPNCGARMDGDPEC